MKPRVVLDTNVYVPDSSIMQSPHPILEFDPEREAIIEPSRLFKPLDGMPEHCVLCFFQNVIEQLVEEGLAVEISSTPPSKARAAFTPSTAVWTAR